MNPMKGATPVPGPIMITGRVASVGSVKSVAGLRVRARGGRPATPFDASASAGATSASSCESVCRRRVGEQLERTPHVPSTWARLVQHASIALVALDPLINEGAPLVNTIISQTKMTYLRRAETLAADT